MVQEKIFREFELLHLYRHESVFVVRFGAPLKTFIFAASLFRKFPGFYVFVYFILFCLFACVFWLVGLVSFLVDFHLISRAFYFSGV